LRVTRGLHISSSHGFKGGKIIHGQTDMIETETTDHQTSRASNNSDQEPENKERNAQVKEGFVTEFGNNEVNCSVIEIQCSNLA